jgi:short-subunit dehydrogenase
MRARRSGRIVNIASIGAVVSPPHLIPYSTSKYALRGMSEGLRHELAGSGVSVTTVCPGLLRTGSTAQARFKGQHRDEHAWFTVADSLPFLSTSASKAADAILDAARHGDPNLTIGVPAKLAAAAQGIAPGLVTKAMEMTAQRLPANGGISIESRPGYQSTSRIAPSVLTKLDTKAAKKLNELPQA